MNFSHFIARRLAFTKGKSFSKIIVRIAICSIAISLATMIVSAAVLAGFKKEIIGKVYDFWGHIHITDTSINSTLRQKPISKNESFISELLDTESITYVQQKSIFGYSYSTEVEEVESYGGVNQVAGFAMVPGLLKTKEEFGATILKGIEYEHTERLSTFIKEGHALSQEPTTSPEIVVSQITADRLELNVGQRILVSTIKNNKEWKKRFVVAGVYSTGLQEYDDRIAFVSLQAAQDILGWQADEVSGFEVYLEDPRDIDLYNEYIYDQMPAGLYSESIQVKYGSIFEWLAFLDINMIVILVLMIVVSVINMITFLLIFIIERSHMIGLFMSIGADNWQIRKVFIYTGAYIIGFGLLLGNILGISICLIQKVFQPIKLDEASYYLEYAPILLSWPTVLLLNIICFVVTVLFLIIPTFLVSKISPIKILRFG